MKREEVKGVLLAVLITACIGVYGQQFGRIARRDENMLTVLRTRLVECARQSPLWPAQPIAAPAPPAPQCERCLITPPLFPGDW